MASSRGHSFFASSSTPSMNPLDTLDIDQYINYDPSPIPPDSYAPESSQNRSMSTPFDSDEYSNNLLLAPTTQQTFAGPSHQYELHKQQTGLPVGALANTFAVNQGDHMIYGQAQRMFGNTGDIFGSNTVDDGFDFNTPPCQMTAVDMELDLGSPVYETNIDYIDPNAVGGQELPANSIASKQRAWPGMHQQQAAMAKAHAQAQQQQQQQQKQQPSTASHRSIPASRHPSQQSSNSAASAKDPIVEERISRLLNQMRHDSVASSGSDAATPNASGSLHQLGRARKDEEDMDEDERLLASEEGKKLSSKERRQLRNKVSARAFRSRRKEYIGQLEGEIAAKTAEADDLRAKNQELMAENTRLTDLTRMLLESPAFSTFLNELSGTDNQTSTTSHTSQNDGSTSKAEDSQPEVPKDVNPHRASSHGIEGSQANAQVGMTLLPESTNLAPAFSMWADSMDSGRYDAQVYAVTSLPEGPILDQFGTSTLSGKPFNAVGSFIDYEAKQDGPIIEYPTPQYETAKAQLPNIERVVRVNARSDEPDTVDDLYSDDIQPLITTALPSSNTCSGSILLHKSVDRTQLRMDDDKTREGRVSVATMQKFLRFCAMMEGPSQRVKSITSHLQ